MFPRSSRKEITEATEENMASRLQLELGPYAFTSLFLYSITATLKGETA